MLTQTKHMTTRATFAALQNETEAQELERSGMRHKLVLQQLSTFEDEAVVYKNIGKAYVCTPKGTIMERFDGELKTIAENFESNKGKKKRLQEAVQSSEKEFTEYLQAHPALGQAYMHSGGA